MTSGRSAVFLLGVMASLSFAANATQVDTRAGILGTDVLNWSASNSGVSFATSTIGGAAVQVTSPLSMTTALQSGPAACGSYPANFFACERVLVNANTPDANAITMQFLSAPISGAGAQFAMAAAYGSFIAVVTAFDAGGSILESYTRDGVTNGAADGSAIFLGIQRTQADIARLDFLIQPYFIPGLGFNGFFAINRVEISTTVTLIPEPAAWAMLLSGILTLGALSARRRRSH